MKDKFINNNQTTMLVCDFCKDEIVLPEGFSEPFTISLVCPLESGAYFACPIDIGELCNECGDKVLNGENIVSLIK